MSVIRSLVLYVVDESQPAIPDAWHGMQAVANRQAEGGHAVSTTNSNEVHVFDIDQFCYGGLAPGRSIEEKLDSSACLFEDWLDEHLQVPFSILVAGQTPIGERCARLVKARALPPYITLRFSRFYGQTGVPYPGETSDPAELFSHDCPKDFAALWQFLSHEGIIKAVQQMNHQALTAAVRSFDFSRRKPVLTFLGPGEAPVLVGT